MVTEAFVNNIIVVNTLVNYRSSEACIVLYSTNIFLLVFSMEFWNFVTANGFIKDSGREQTDSEGRLKQIILVYEVF